MNKDIISAIKEIASEAAVFINEPMSKHTTFRIGGPAELFVRPDCLEKVVKIIDLCKKNSIPSSYVSNLKYYALKKLKENIEKELKK